MSSADDLLRFVNILQGTDSHYGFSTGNTLPLTAMPFGMNHWSPQTAEGSWFFSPRDRKLQGVRCTHQPSPWIGDYGAFTILPQIGRAMYTAGSRSSAYRLDRSTLRPDRFAAELIRYRTTFEMAPTERGAIFRFHFPTSAESRVIIEPVKGESHAELRPDGRIAGWTRGSSGGTLEGFAHYFVADFDAPPIGCTLFSGRDEVPGVAHDGDRAGIAATFATTEGRPLVMRLATSFISLEQAERNLATELGDRDYGQIAAAATEAWERALSAVHVEGDEKAVRTFYSCLYRTQLFPRMFHEFDASGNPYHYSPFSGEVHPGVLYTDNGFWDTYRTTYPLFALLMPERLAEILEGWVNACKEGGWFPQWASPGYRACMVGTHIDAVFADGVCRGVTDFDMASALSGMVKHAYEPGSPDGAFGRIGIEDYRRLGFVPADIHHEALARSLDYAYDDFCIAQVATALGEQDRAGDLTAACQTYRNSYDAAVGFMRGRNADGSWLEPWDEYRWGSPYVEGGPWQSTWAVQHDPAGLIALMGGDEAFAAKLDRMLATPPHFEVGVYGMEIHEMTEMAVAEFGQYAHSNQPVHHVLYLYNAAGRPWRTQAEVRRVMAELYSPSHQPGDEDNGEMSAWFVLSALGLFPLCPGRPAWTFGSPLFRKAVVRLPDSRELVVEAPGNGADAPFIETIEFAGRVHAGLEIDHAAIASGGTLTFRMSHEPVTRPTPGHLRPASVSPYA